MFGREVNLPLTVQLGVFPIGDRPQCPVEYVEWVQNTLESFPFCETEHRVECTQAETLSWKKLQDKRSRTRDVGVEMVPTKGDGKIGSRVERAL